MIFNTAEYFLLFLIPSALLFRAVRPTAKPWILCFSGVLFFLYFSFYYLGGAIGAFCVLVFVWESLFSRLYKQGSIYCVIGVIQALAILFIFKYWNFTTGLFFGAENPWFWAGAFLPLGVSFFTFEFIHYAVDRYQGKAERGSLGEYLAFILFFPTMVAGPIKRFQDFYPKLSNPSTNWSLDWSRGITRILAGLFKKFAIADFLTSLTDNLNAQTIPLAERWVLVLWLFAYGLKIYFDFSAYSDIAIGSARLFGIAVPENFNWPYFQRNIAAFWNHWHISLYRWLVDYVFIPLGGSRVGKSKTLCNIVATMLISGIWHGAGLNFLVWGLWHGALLVAHRLWSSARESGKISFELPAPVAWALTFISVNAGWSFFCMDMPTALLFWKRLLNV